MRGDAGERRLHALEIAKHRIAENRIAAPRLPARRRAVARARRDEIYKPVGFVHRQRSKKRLVEDREDGDIRADAERHRQDGNGGDDRSLQQ